MTNEMDGDFWMRVIVIGFMWLLFLNWFGPYLWSEFISWIKRCPLWHEEEL